MRHYCDIFSNSKIKINDDYLIHYGIKGQKWGVRRFQNEDNTLTEEGRQRYGIGERRFAYFPKLGSPIKRTGSSIQINTHKTVSNRMVQTLRTPVQKQASQKMPTKEQIQAQKEKAKKIIIAAGAVSLAAIMAFGANRYLKARKGLIGHARQHIIDSYKNAMSNSASMYDEAAARKAGKAFVAMNKELGRTNSMRSAKKELHLKNAHEVWRYMKNNRLFL